MELNAQMNAHMNETLNIGGALLVKLFGRAAEEEQRFRERAAGVRDIGVQRAVLGTSLFAVLGIIGAVGTALDLWHRRLLRHPGQLHHRHHRRLWLLSRPPSTARCRDWQAPRWISAPPWSPSSASSR